MVLSCALFPFSAAKSLFWKQLYFLFRIFFGIGSGLEFFGWVVSGFLGGGGKLCCGGLSFEFFSGRVFWGEMEQC